MPARVGLSIDKNIPVAAGLAGGSADAAAALLACDRLWGLDLPAEELATLAARLGSDVAFALLGGTAVGAGRGERLRPVDGAAASLGTGGGRRRPVHPGGLRRAGPAARRRRPGPPATRPRRWQPAGVVEAITGGDPELLAGRLGNDLQPAAVALAPYLADTLAAGRDCGALAGLVSGSGPTCAFLARDDEHARTLAGALAGTGSCRQALAVTGGTARPTVLG